MSNADYRKHVVIIGGGIAGVTCAETLSSLSDGALRISLISLSEILKVAVNTVQLTRTTELFDVQESSTCSLKSPAIQVIKGRAVYLDVYGDDKKKKGKVGLDDGSYLEFDACCVATGARPAVPEVLKGNLSDRVLVVRDTDSVERLKRKLGGAKTLMLVGNGGIALELVHELSGCDVLWVVKNDYVGHAFFDKRTSQVLTRMAKKNSLERQVQSGAKVFNERHVKDYSFKDGTSGKVGPYGAGVGPDWIKPREQPHIIIHDTDDTAEPSFQHPVFVGGRDGACKLKVLYECEVEDVELVEGEDERSFKLKVTLSNGTVVHVDLIIAATGVSPNVEWLSSSPLEVDASCEIGEMQGGIVVESPTLSTNCEGIYAAGDCTSTRLTKENAPCAESDWFQMRLWTQARTAGRVVARSIAAHVLGEHMQADGLEFEIFAHATRFFGLKVVLLGRYNAQGLGSGFRILESAGVEGESTFVRVVLLHGRMRGAILIGETGLEEAYENLILDRLQVEHLGSELVDPSIDLEDYFD